MLRKTFCSSPWFHLRKTYDGTYRTCRYATRHAPGVAGTAGSIMEFYNSEQMRQLRTDLLTGDKPHGCSACYYQDEHGKLNGRTRQLLKSGITVKNFENSILGSPHFKHFTHSYKNQGISEYYPTDLQIELSRLCNSACIMCEPEYSSRLEPDFRKLHEIEPSLFYKPVESREWTRDKDELARISAELASIPNIRYVHFLGGETLYDQSFYDLCDSIIKSGSNRNIIVGTTTNSTLYDERIEMLAKEFKEFHLGVSIEAVSPLNDYIRWPSKIAQVKENLEKFVNLRNKIPTLVLSARITPNIFSIYEFDELAKYLFELGIIAESCNILFNPMCLRMELMPEDIRAEVIDKLQKLVDDMALKRTEVYNIRHRKVQAAAMSNTVIEYLEFVKNYETPVDADAHRRDLVKYLKAFESLRGNSIIDYAPRYTDFLRSFGY